MILTVRKIELVNWMTHRQETVEFPDNGVFLLWGKSGAGKSSLLEAIAFALAGHTATRAQKIDELKHELYPEEDLQVRLTLGLGDERQVQIFRGTEKGRSIVWMVDHDGTLLEGNAQVKERVAQLLGGMDGPTLFATYYSQQGELDALIKMAGGGRRQFVQRMLGVSVLDGVIRDVRKAVSGAQERIGLIDETLPTETVEELRQSLNTLRQERSVNEEMLQALAIEIEAVEIRGKQLRGILQDSKESWETFQTLTPQVKLRQEQEIPSQMAEIERLAQELVVIQTAATRLDNQPDKEVLIALQAEAETLASAEGALQALKEKESAVVVATEAAHAAHEALAHHRQQPLPEGENPRDLANQQAELRSEYRMVVQELEELPTDESFGDECYACLRPFDETSRKHVHQTLAHKQTQLQERQQQLSTAGQGLKTRLATAEQQATQIEEHRRVLAQLEQTYQHCQQQVAAAEAAVTAAQQSAHVADADRLKVVRAQLQQASETLAAIRQDEQIVQRKPGVTHDHQAAQERLHNLHTSLTTDQATLASINIDPAARAEQEEQYEWSRAKYIELVKRRGEATTEAQRISGDIQAVEGGIARHQQLAEDRKEASEKALKYGNVETSVRDFRQYLIGTIRPMLEDLTSAHLSELTDGVMSAVAISEEYDVSIKRHGEFRRIGLCSGGEQARAAFSLRLALTQLVSQRTDTPVGFMVFDEIFGSQDEEHRKAILDALVHLRGIYPQVFLISHEETLKDSPLVSMILSVPDAESTNRITVENR